MSIEKFIDNREAASPIDQDDVSTSELNITQLSLPDSFDESLCLDLYMELKGQGHRQSKSEPLLEKAQSNNSNEPLGDQQHNELELQVRELLSANLELKEKGRLYDSLKRRSAENDAVIEELRSQVQNHIVREKELQHQILEYKRKAHLTGIDLEHARKESEVYLSRAEKAEKDYEESATALRKYENDLSRINAQREEAKFRSDREIARIREECSNEIASSRAHQNEAFARESKLLCFARDQAIEQTKSLQQVLSEVRTEKETKDAENSDIIKELEGQLADVRSDLKVKSCEMNTLQTCQDRTLAEADKFKEENDKHVEVVVQLQKKYAILERQSGRLEEVIRQKDDALEIYHHDDLLVDCDAGSIEPSCTGLFSGRKSLVKNSVALARKCRELQVLLKKKSDELAILRENNEMLSKKEESNQRLFSELTVQNNKNASAYIISAINARDNEILKLSSKIMSLRMNMSDIARERDDISSKLSQVLERRERLDEMKGLVESMRHDASSRHAGNAHDDEDLEHDLLDHIIHHRSK
ncbi:hypothetical protein ACHAXR_003366 [Thalassiosira sp. AJA248-18]